MTDQSNDTLDKRLSAVCGLFCPACTVFIATHQDPDRLRRLAEHFGLPEETVKCYGCRSDKRLPYCQTCKMAICSKEKNIDFCEACEDYPCEELKQFQAEQPHRIELWENQIRIREVGYEQWFEEMMMHYSCPNCKTINSAYDITCRKCGREPSCNYVERHKQALLKHLSEHG